MKRLCDTLSELVRCKSGSALVEMTFVAPLAILLMVGAVDFGRALFTQATASKSVHDAARYLGGLSKSAICDNPDCVQDFAKGTKFGGVRHNNSSTRQRVNTWLEAKRCASCR